MFKLSQEKAVIIGVVGIALASWIAIANLPSPVKETNHYNTNPNAVKLEALKTTILYTAKDPSSVQFRNPQIYSNGVCIDVNAKNSFGAFTGFTEFCSIQQKNGTSKISQNGRFVS